MARSTYIYVVYFNTSSVGFFTVKHEAIESAKRARRSGDYVQIDRYRDGALFDDGVVVMTDEDFEKVGD